MMRIAFVCGGLEPGRDGVGDYTRLLATACAARGHAVRLLAVCDSNASNSTPSVCTDTNLPMLRLSAQSWRGDGGAAARAWLDEFSPDWICLQFVPYSFDPRGLFGSSLPALLHTLGAAPRRQLFFHEIQIGSHQGASFRQRATGWWQRATTKRMLHQLCPTLVQTSTTYYREALVRLGADAEVLPLFGNVPTSSSARNPSPAEPASDALVCGFFGTLHPGWNADAFLADFAVLAASRQQHAMLVSAGSLGVGEAEFDRLAKIWTGRVSLRKLGRQPASGLADIFKTWDFAVTSMPWITLGKSGTVAALREHGLAVVVTAAGSPPRFGALGPTEADADPGCIPYFRDHAGLALALKKADPRPGLEATTTRFLDRLSTCG